MLKLTVIPKKIREYYSGVVLGTMKQREEKNILRPDMINILMEAKKGVNLIFLILRITYNISYFIFCTHIIIIIIIILHTR